MHKFKGRKTNTKLLSQTQKQKRYTMEEKGRNEYMLQGVKR